MKTQMVCEKVGRDLNPGHHVSMGIHPASFISRDSCHNIDEDIHACFRRLKQLVPTARLNSRLSKVQLIQQVIDYILDLESTLDTKPTEKYCNRSDDTVLTTENSRTSDKELITSRYDVSGSNSRQPLAERAFAVNFITSSSNQQTEEGSNVSELS